MFIALICLIPLALAEPPVDNGYPAARSFQEHHHHDHETSDRQRSLSEEYGPPSDTTSRNSPSAGHQYNALNARSFAGRSQFAPPTVRVSFNQRFGSATSGNSAKATLDARSRSQGHNAISEISQEYGPPSFRSLSQEYGVPSIASARTLSTEYGLPNVRSEEYDSSVIVARSNQEFQAPVSNFRIAQSPRASSEEYSSHAYQSRFNSGQSSRSNNAPQGYDANSAFASRSAPLSTFGSSTSLSTLHGGPSVRSSYSEDFSGANGVQNARESLPHDHAVPSSRNAFSAPSDDNSSRTSPSSTYLPASRNAMPSEQYGVPDQSDAANTRALEELQNQEPASYDFAYQIEDNESGSDFGHTETREEGRAHGSYFVMLPDGTKQTVEYEADERGFKPRISVEPAMGGYDDNAADTDLARSTGGPY